MVTKPRVYVIVLNWNGYKDTIECIKSLETVVHKNYDLKVAIVDNGSTDISLSEIARVIKNKQNYQVIENKENLGFAGGNNMGIRFAISKHADYVCVLNNDTIVDKNLIEEFIKISKQYPMLGAITPKIYFAKGYEFHKKRYKAEELGKVVWSAGGEIDWDNVYGKNVGVDEVDNGQFDETREVEFATGACALLNVNSLREVGLYNENYFMYLEDVELSQRMRLKTWKIVYAPKAVVWHKVSQSSSIGNALSDYFITRNRLAFGLKYSPLRSKFALLRESIWFAQNGRQWQITGAKDFYLNRFGKGSWK